MLSIYLLMFVSLDIFVWAPETLLCTEYHSSESLTEAPNLVAGLWAPHSLRRMEKLRNKLC
jgi:hypothetical protein